MASKTGFLRKTSPYVREPKAKVEKMMYDVLIALIPVIIFTIYKYEFTAVWIILVSIVSMVGTEFLYYKLRKEPFTMKNGTALISALIYALIMPDVTPLWIVFIGGVFGMYFGKLVFGGMGANIFNVAGFARVFIVISFGAFLVYDVDTVAGATALGVVKANPFDMMILGDFNLWNMFTGVGEAGSIGELSGIAILLGGLYLAFRKSLDWRIPVSYIGTVLGLSTIAALIVGAEMTYPLFTILSGGILFGAIFMATDPITSPVTGPGRIYYGFGLGVITFFIRIFGALPEGVVFAILIMNMFVPALDYYKWANSKFTIKSTLVFSVVVLVTVGLLVVGVWQ
ncbi:RnfABCDGE type electron transport complex subunit D [Mycoplasmatota bacterium]|nr:RnfABCDGE type electron transport complex subunit D [Mycoplasmatota bacterium]